MPNIDLDKDVGGYATVKKQLRSEILDVLTRKDQLTEETQILFGTAVDGRMGDRLSVTIISSFTADKDSIPQQISSAIPHYCDDAQRSWTSAARSGSINAARPCDAEQTCCAVIPAAPRKSAPAKFAPSSSAPRRTALVK